MSKHTIHTPGEQLQADTPTDDGAELSIRDTLAAMQAKIDAQTEQIASMGQTAPAKVKEAELPTEAEGMAQAKKTGQNVLSQAGWCMAPAVAIKA
jgi:hypothetical protein